MKILTELKMLSMTYGDITKHPGFEQARKKAIKSDRCMLCGGNRVCQDGLCSADFNVLTEEEKKIANSFNYKLK